MKKTTVDHKILLELLAKKKVSTVRLGHRSGSFAVHSAIARLRRQGWDITCSITNDGKRKAWYSLDIEKSQKNNKYTARYK